MIGHEFKGIFAAQKTSEHGDVIVSCGQLTTTTDSEPVIAMYFKITDCEGSVVAEYALTGESYRRLLDAMIDVDKQIRNVLDGKSI